MHTAGIGADGHDRTNGQPLSILPQTRRHFFLALCVTDQVAVLLQ